MTAWEQIRVLSVVVDCFSYADLHSIHCCMVLHHSEVMATISNAPHIVVHPLVRFEHKHIGQHKGVLVCGFA